MTLHDSLLAYNTMHVAVYEETVLVITCKLCNDSPLRMHIQRSCEHIYTLHTIMYRDASTHALHITYQSQHVCEHYCKARTSTTYHSFTGSPALMLTREYVIAARLYLLAPSLVTTMTQCTVFDPAIRLNRHFNYYSYSTNNAQNSSRKHYNHGLHLHSCLLSRLQLLKHDKLKLLYNNYSHRSNRHNTRHATTLQPTLTQHNHTTIIPTTNVQIHQ